MKTNNEEGKIAAEKDEEARSQGSRGARDLEWGDHMAIRHFLRMQLPLPTSGSPSR